MYCKARSFVVVRYGTNNEDFREFYEKRQNRRSFRLLQGQFELEIVLICCRKLTETTTFSLFTGFNILVHKVYR